MGAAFQGVGCGVDVQDVGKVGGEGGGLEELGGGLIEVAGFFEGEGGPGGSADGFGAGAGGDGGELKGGLDCG